MKAYKDAKEYLEGVAFYSGDPERTPTRARQLLNNLVIEHKKLLMVMNAERNLRYWYEEEHERSCYSDCDLPEDLLELEHHLEKVRESYE